MSSLVGFLDILKIKQVMTNEKYENSLKNDVLKYQNR